MNDETQEHQASQARCMNMPNDEPEGHYWSWVNAPQSVPNQYRECISCGRIDASEWLASRDQQIALDAVNKALDYIVDNPDSWKKKLDRKKMIEGYKRATLKAKGEK